MVTVVQCYPQDANTETVRRICPAAVTRCEVGMKSSRSDALVARGPNRCPLYLSSASLDRRATAGNALSGSEDIIESYCCLGICWSAVAYYRDIPIRLSTDRPTRRSSHGAVHFWVSGEVGTRALRVE